MVIKDYNKNNYEKHLLFFNNYYQLKHKKLMIGLNET